MEEKVTAYEELQKVQQLEQEAALIARQYKRKADVDVDAIIVSEDEIRRQNAYLRMLTETMEAMTASMKMTSSEAEVSSSELMAGISELEELADLQDVDVSGEQVNKLMDVNKHGKCDDIVSRIKETMHSIREMMYDLEMLAKGTMTDPAAGDDAAEDESEVLRKLPLLLHHKCPSLYAQAQESSSGKGTQENGIMSESKKKDTASSSSSPAWIQLEEKMWQLTSALSSFRQERRSDKMIKCLKRLQDAEEVLNATRARHASTDAVDDDDRSARV